MKHDAPERSFHAEAFQPHPEPDLVRLFSTFRPATIEADPSVPVGPLTYHRVVASENYKGSPRYDFVQINGDDGKWFAKIEFCLQLKHRGTIYRLIFVCVYEARDIQHRVLGVPRIIRSSPARYQLISIDAVDQRVVLRPDFCSDGYFFVHI